MGFPVRKPFRTVHVELAVMPLPHISSVANPHLQFNFACSITLKLSSTISPESVEGLAPNLESVSVENLLERCG